jgi:hypothetical protein
MPVAQSTHPSAGNPLQLVLQQLTQSLAVLSGTADLLVKGTLTEQTSQTLRIWLPPNARQAEEAMHRLRAMRLPTSPAITELSQCLTVLVLAADMLAQGQLSGADALTFYDLLRRNADSAIKHLSELCEQFSPASQSVGSR